MPQIAPLSAVTELTNISYERDSSYFADPDGWRSLAKTLPIPIGLSDAGVLELDLIEQGPHMLIGGTTGSGKSELLQTITCGAISRYSPDEVSLFLVDFKGGATFAPFRRLPHVVGFVTDLDQRNVNRALDFLRSELRRREQAFESLGNAKEVQRLPRPGPRLGAFGNRPKSTSCPGSSCCSTNSQPLCRTLSGTRLTR